MTRVRQPLAAHICFYENPKLSYFVYISFVRKVDTLSRDQINNFVQTVYRVSYVFVGNWHRQRNLGLPPPLLIYKVSMNASHFIVAPTSGKVRCSRSESSVVSACASYPNLFQCQSWPQYLHCFAVGVLASRLQLGQLLIKTLSRCSLKIFSADFLLKSWYPLSSKSKVSLSSVPHCPKIMSFSRESSAFSDLIVERWCFWAIFSFCPRSPM